MTTEQRLDRVEDDLAAVRQLLASAATYAESANRRTEQQAERIDQLISSQNRTQTQLDQLTARVDQLSSRVDTFVFEAQRLFTKSGTALELVEGQTERLEAIVRRLDRNYEAQQSQLQEFKRTTNAALERIDRVLDYLLRQSGGGGQGQP